MGEDDGSAKLLPPLLLPLLLLLLASILVRVKMGKSEGMSCAVFLPRPQLCRYKCQKYCLLTQLAKLLSLASNLLLLLSVSCVSKVKANWQEPVERGGR